jgi:DNA-binding response OmpR family regulator
MEKPKALIVEDSLELIAMFAQALLEAGYEVACLTDGESAQAYLATTIPDLLLLDLHLPHISGEQLITQVRQEARFRQTRIIIVSADYRRGDELQELADLVLQKPVSYQQLRDLSNRFAPDMTLHKAASPNVLQGKRP